MVKMREVLSEIRILRDDSEIKSSETLHDEVRPLVAERNNHASIGTEMSSTLLLTVDNIALFWSFKNDA